MNENLIKKLRVELSAAQTTIWNSLSMLQEKVEKLDLQERTNTSHQDQVPDLEDIGRWVLVTNNNPRGDEDWGGPKLLTEIVPGYPQPFRADAKWWTYAKLAPTVAKVTTQLHDGNSGIPDWLNVDDYVVVEEEGHPGRYSLLQALEVEWNLVTYYQKVEVKRE